MVAYGFSGSTLGQYFSFEAVETFVRETIASTGNAAAAANLQFGGNVGTFFDGMVDAFDFSQQQATVASAQGNAGATSLGQLFGNIANAFQDAENTLTQTTGATFDDINYSISPDGTVTVNVDGVGSNSVNINDSLQQAGAEAGVDTSFAESFFM